VIAATEALLHLGKTVTKIAVQGNSKYTLSVKDPEDNSISEESFDIVVIATPLEIANIELEGIDIPQLTKRPFQTTHVTVVEGHLSKKYFNMAESDDLPDMIGTTEGVSFSSIAVKGKAKEHPVYKIFSRTQLSEEYLTSLFVERTFTKKFQWQAYPVMIPTDEFPPFRLHSQLYYLNAVENALSAMESEAVAAKNIANLIHKSWNL